MLRLWVMSDLHLEAVHHPDAYRPRCAGFDVLVMAGDVRHGSVQAVATVTRPAGGKPSGPVRCPPTYGWSGDRRAR